jgi:hypothetical protein
MNCRRGHYVPPAIYCFAIIAQAKWFSIEINAGKWDGNKLSLCGSSEKDRFSYIQIKGMNDDHCHVANENPWRRAKGFSGFCPVDTGTDEGAARMHQLWILSGSE